MLNLAEFIEAEEEILEYQNFNITDIVTPVKVRELESLLKKTGYDKEKTHFLVQGFSKGFDIGYRGPKNRQDEAKNLPLRVGSKTKLWNKVMSEVKLKRYAGPFSKPPFRHYILSNKYNN